MLVESNTNIELNSMTTCSRPTFTFSLLILVAPHLSADEFSNHLEILSAANAADINTTPLSRKQVTVHNCDSAGEALAEAESRNPGWTAYNAKNVSGRTWIVSMKKP